MPTAADALSGLIAHDLPHTVHKELVWLPAGDAVKV